MGGTFSDASSAERRDGQKSGPGNASSEAAPPYLLAHFLAFVADIPVQFLPQFIERLVGAGGPEQTQSRTSASGHSHGNKLKLATGENLEPYTGVVPVTRTTVNFLTLVGSNSGSSTLPKILRAEHMSENAISTHKLRRQRRDRPRGVEGGVDGSAQHHRGVATGSRCKLHTGEAF